MTKEQIYENFPLREENGSEFNSFYNAFAKEIRKLADEGLFVENDNGEFIGWANGFFNKWFTSPEVLLGACVWRNDILLISEEYGKYVNYFYRKSDIFTEDQKKMIDEAVNRIENVFDKISIVPDASYKAFYHKQITEEEWERNSGKAKYDCQVYADNDHHEKLDSFVIHDDDLKSISLDEFVYNYYKNGGYESVKKEDKEAEYER